MAQDLLQVPVSLILAGDLPASAKLIWMVAQLRSAPVRPGPGWLCAISGLSRPTVLAGVAGLIAAGWDPILVVEPDATVPIPAPLLQNPRLGIHSRLLYGHLLMTPGFSHPCGHFTNAELAALARVTVPTVINAISELVRAEWIKVDRKHRLARTTFELTFPGWARGMAALDKATQRLQIPGHRGEMLMREYLTLLIDQENYQDNATPPRLANPPTEGLLQLDRYYSPAVGFEFNGAQHYKSTKKYSVDVVIDQQERDFTKLGRCTAYGITLVVVHAGDLTLKGMQAKVGNLLPLRDLAGYQLLIDYLEFESANYRRRVAFL